MLDETGKRAVVFNGEIYNFRELRAGLQSQGYTFRTNSDTEVILAMYDRHGVDCLKHFNGMFAFALWDGIDAKLILARDRLGIKPLYYTYAAGKRLVFASEIKSLLAFPGVNREPNIRGLSSYLSFRRVMGSETLFKGINMLRAGCFMEVDRGGERIHRYWQLPSDKYMEVDDELCFERTEELLELAVKRRMISDVPLGAFLSGGLDSSAVVALMSGLQSEPVKTYSIGFEDEKYNELDYCRMVAEYFETDHHELVLKEKDYIETIPELICYKDEPLAVANEVALYLLAKYLKKDITVVLSGEGADELFVGYGRIFRSPYDYMRMRSGSGDPDEMRLLRSNIKELYGRTEFADEVDHFLSLYKWMDYRTKRKVLNRQIMDHLEGDLDLVLRIRHIFDSVGHLSQYDKYLYFFQVYHLENLLRRVDATTMAASVEARVPFVDHELVEHVFRLPFDAKLRWRSKKHMEDARALASSQISETHDIPKYILKKIMNDKLPEGVVARKKMGFPVPMDSFFRNGFFDYAREILCDDRTRHRKFLDCAHVEEWLMSLRGSVKHSEALQIWMLVNVELWFRLYFDEVPYESDHISSRKRREALPAY